MPIIVLSDEDLDPYETQDLAEMRPEKRRKELHQWVDEIDEQEEELDQEIKDLVDMLDIGIVDHD